MTRCNCNDPTTCHDPESHKMIRCVKARQTPSRFARGATITTGGGSPRRHDTEPVTRAVYRKARRA